MARIICEGQLIVLRQALNRRHQLLDAAEVARPRRPESGGETGGPGEPGPRWRSPWFRHRRAGGGHSMSGISREATGKAFWQAAGTLLGELRARRGWTRPELAERAGLSADLVTIYETDPERYPELEAWWRMTTAIGVDLGTFLRHVENRAGVRLLHDVRLPQAATGTQRGATGM